MMKTRQRILNHLKKTRDATAKEIARALNLSAPNVRYHLSVLGSDGRVEVVPKSKQDARGRPEKYYSLSQAALGDNLPALTDALLSQVGSTVAWTTIAHRLIDPIEASNLPAVARLRVLVEKLNQMRYQSRWEAGAEGPRILFERCPYVAVIEEHPELCQMDASLLSDYLGMEVRQLGRIEKTQGMCIFAVR
jgi:predicted ArsR family transcriptional regulator